MSDLYVLRLASQNAEWLAERQSLIAGNVANANTPGYRARDLKPLDPTFDAAQFRIATTNAAHLTPTSAETGGAAVSESPSWEETYSGNSVNIEQQMVKLGDVSRGYQMNVNIKRAIHQMLAAVLK